MKKLRGLMLAVVTFSLMVTVAAFARDKNHHSVVIPETLQVGTTRLAPGEYTMQWTESGATAEVNFVQNGKSVAQAPAKIVNLARPSASDSLTTRTTTDNTKALEEVEFGGHKEAFSFSDTPAGE
jgi:hypothetical protein